jgi:hypothetical protein
LNLFQGLAGTFIDSIIETRNREDARNGVNFEENRRKRKEKALEDQRLKTRRFDLNISMLRDSAQWDQTYSDKLKIVSACKKRKGVSSRREG